MMNTKEKRETPIISFPIKVGIYFVMVCFFSLVGCKTPIKERTTEPIKARKPNVLFIIVDDLNDWTGHLNGHPQTLTPNMDKLAAKGTVFTNAHANAPLCGPSRASLLTGLRPSTTGVYFQIGDPDLTNQVVSDSIKAKFLPNHFKENGYETWGVGKIFHWGDAGGVFNQYGRLADFGPWPENRFKYDPEWFGKPKGTSTDWGAFPNNDSLTFDQRIADWSIAKLNESHDKPFLLVTGFMRPHVPWYVPKRWMDKFDPKTIELPEYNPTDWEDIPEKAALVTNWPMMPEMEWMLENDRWSEAVGAYLASVHFVDHQIGRVLDALNKSEHADNTIVVLTSDHGYHLGEKGLFQKGTLWQRSTHVPLIFSSKGTKLNSSEEPTSLLDIYPTLIEMCGLPKLDQLDGKSLNPILEGEKQTINNTAITTYGPNNHSIIDRNWHYIRYSDGTDELYNLKNDSNEWENLANVDSLSYVKEEMKVFFPKTNMSNNKYSHIDTTPYYLKYRKTKE